MKKKRILVVLFLISAIVGNNSIYAQEGVRVLVSQVDTSIYIYKVMNFDVRPIVTFMVGRNYSLDSSENELSIIPTGIESPPGWDGHNVFREESAYIHIAWDIRDQAFAILPGSSLDSFIVRMPQSYDLMKEVSFSTIHHGGIITSGNVELDPSPLVLFDGKGQRPADVNSFLSYLKPLEAQTTLPQGQSAYYLLIFYGKTIQPQTFKATLNGADISGSFHPNPDSSDAVKLNLQQGRNTLVVSVDGIRNDGRKATDTDRLVFIVP